MKNSKVVDFLGYTCKLKFGRYINGRTAIQLMDEEGLVATATVNVVDLEHLGDDEVIIKSYSENEGMFEALYSAGIISAPLQRVKTGFVEIPICKLLVNPEDYEN